MKSKTVAALLAFFFGGVGAHKFYLGKNGQGILYLIFVWTWVPAILGLIESISYLTMSEYDFNMKYNKVASDIPHSSNVEILADKPIYSKVSEVVPEPSYEAIDTPKPIRSSSLLEARKKMAAASKANE